MKLFSIPKNPTIALLLLLAVWWIVNIIQASFTELANDEAYYYMFSQNLDWGYFDHPPMTALLVRLGSFIGGELGVRLLFTLLQPIYLYLLWEMIRPKFAEVRHAVLFVLLAAAMPILQLYGFLAVPDGPLMLFTALFLWSYKKFSEQNSWKWAIWMGVFMAALAYSKYHGALLVLLVILSNLRLLKNPKFYTACLFTLVLITPHLLWQYHHDWLSFRYHLTTRSRDFEWGFVSEYLLNILAVFNPFIFPIIFKAWWKSHSETAIQRALIFITVGFISFFLFSTSRGYVQPQWIIPATFGILALLFGYTEGRERLTHYLCTVAWITIGLIALLRIEMIFNPLGVNFEIFNNATSYGQLKSLAGNTPIIFDGNYTAPAKYNFYTGGSAYGQPSVHKRSSQYELLSSDTEWIGKPVIIQVSPSTPGAESLALSTGIPFSFLRVEAFYPSRKVKIESTPLPTTVQIGDTLSLEVTLSNPYPYNFEIDADSCAVLLVWERRGEDTHTYPLPELHGTLTAEGKEHRTVQFIVPKLSLKPYRVGFTLINSPMNSWFNSKVTSIEVLPASPKNERQ